MTDAEDLAQRLLTLAGTIMEDTSGVLILQGDAPVGARTEALAAAAEDLRVLATAVGVVTRRGEGEVARGPT